MNDQCPVCSSKEYKKLLVLSDYPVEEGVFYAFKDDAINCVTEDIRLYACGDCSYVGNEGFDPDKLRFDKDYNVSLHHSPLYNAFIDDVVSRLILDYDLRDKTILEIGCGKGEFLTQICERGQNTGIGIDPSVELPNTEDSDHRVRFISDFYSDKYAELKVDFICCRHVLDLVPDSVGYVQMIRSATKLSHDAVFYFEVPNGAYTFSDMVLWNLAFSNRSYFYPCTLQTLFQRCEFDVLRIAPCFESDQYLGIELRISRHDVHRSEELPPLRNGFVGDVSEFPSRFRTKITAFKRVLEENVNNETRIVAWGAGARAISFFQLYDLSDRIDYVVDINPGKQGKYIPGSGQLVVDPSFLRSNEPDLIVITNHSFEQEIRSSVNEMGLHCRFLVLS